MNWFWICGVFAVVFASIAAFARTTRVCGVALLVCGMSVGGVFLALGAEMLAVLQWLISILVAVSFVFYSVMFGNDGSKKNTYKIALALAVGSAVLVLLLSSLRDFLKFTLPKIEEYGLDKIGATLMADGFLPLGILSLTLFLMVIGVGIVSRMDRGQS